MENFGIDFNNIGFDIFIMDIENTTLYLFFLVVKSFTLRKRALKRRIHLLEERYQIAQLFLAATGIITNEKLGRNTGGITIAVDFLRRELGSIEYFRLLVH